MPTAPIIFLLALFVVAIIALAWQRSREKHRLQRWLANCNQKCEQYLLSLERPRTPDKPDAALRRSNPVLEKQQ